MHASRNWLIAGPLVLAACAVSFAAMHSTAHSDTALRLQFFMHRADFEKLVAMFNEDKHLVRIAPDFTWLDDNGDWPRKNVGISEQRWNAYRRLFRSVGAPDGILRGPDSSRISFPIVSVGLVPAGWTKGLVYSRTPPNPLLKSLDERPPDRYWERGHVLVYAPVEDHWYIYFEQW